MTVRAPLLGAERLPLLVLSLTFALVSAAAHGQECETASFSLSSPAGLKTFKINNVAGEQYLNNDTEASQAAVLGSAQWNEQGNATYFRYDGDTTDTDADCSGDSLVYFDPNCFFPTVDQVGISALAETKCSNSRFLIRVFKKVDDNRDFDCDDAGETRVFSNGIVTGSGAVRDTVGLITHEFGHVVGLGHCNDDSDNSEAGVYCTMRTGTMGNATWRNLHEWDLNCSATNKRELTGYNQSHDNTGFLGASTFTSAGTITKATSGVTYDGGTAYWASGAHRRTSIGWVEDPYVGATWRTLTNPGTNNGVGMLAALRMEDTSRDLFWYSYWQDSTQYDEEANHYARQILSDDDFVSDQEADWLYRCSNATGFLNCSLRTQVRTAHRIALAYLPSTGRSVTAWLNQDNTGGTGDDGDNQEIWISVGYRDDTDDDTLALPYETGLKSAVGVGLACSENFSGSYDCLMAYVPAEVSPMENLIKVRRFSVSLGGGANNYTVSIEGSDQTVSSTSRTANSIAVWYNTSTDLFYLADRSSNSGQNVVVYSSAAGTSWSLVTGSLDASAIPPSAASYFVGTNNLLVYAK